MIEVHAEFPQREVIQANAVVDNEEKTISEVIISAKPEITGVTASVDNETGTPYVDVTETGTGTEFSFDLAFHNLKGDKGEQGEQGEPGQNGQDGTDGQDGFSPIATVEPIQGGAKITITDKDGTTTTNVYNGTDGTDGADGQAATVTVGTTTTGAEGTNASVVNSGTSSAAILDFIIPRGNTGATGVSVTGVNLISTQGLQKTYRMTFSNNTYYDYIVTDGASGSTVWGGISGVLSNQTDLQTELTGLQSQIDAIVSSSDVFDIVGTYAELQAYDISTVPVNDIIKVLVDSTHSNAATYYRCVETGGVKSWSYIGSEGAYYTKSETDTLLNDKYDISNPAGYTSNIGTVTSVNNTLPDANGNVTIQTGGANTDLSNLTATGEAHFQTPLISGTNIKTINNISILGSGNLNVGKNIGEIVTSTIPLTDAGLHLLDGALLQYGSYQEFIDYIAGLVTDYPDLFVTEASWQSAVTTYGACGKFVYDDVNNTVRLPKLTGILEGTTDLTALGDLVEAGLPNITGSIESCITAKAGSAVSNGALFFTNNGGTRLAGTSSSSTVTSDNDIGINASLANSIYGSSTTVQPQAIKVLYYIVIATSTKTQIQVDIDEIATDLNGKADTDLANTTPSSAFVDNMFIQCSPDYEAGVSKSSSGFTADEDGWLMAWGSVQPVSGGTKGSSTFYINNTYISLAYTGGTSGNIISSGYRLFPILNGDVVTVSQVGNAINFEFFPLKGAS